MEVPPTDTQMGGSCDCGMPSTPSTDTMEEVVAPNTPMALLPPDHPLLRKFQKALNEHLLRSKEELANQIAEIRHNVKVKDEKRIEAGAQLYELQEKLSQQTKQIDEYSQEIQKNVDSRRDYEKAIAELKTTFAKSLEMEKEQKSLYNKRVMEMEHTQQIENNIRKWTDEMEDEVLNAKRVVNRDAQLQKQLSEEKRKTDMLFLNLDVEMKKQEYEHKNVTDELRETREAIEVLQMSISTSNTDLEVIQSEHKRLTKAWSEVILAISHRDKINHQIVTEVEKQKEFIKLKIFGIKSIKKQISKETEQNEKLESFKMRLTTELGALTRECQKGLDALGALDDKLELLPTMLERTELDMKEAKREGTELETELQHIQRKLIKQAIVKLEIEEEILKLAEEQLMNDKASKFRLKILHDTQDQRRRMELALGQAQNQLAQTLFDLERSKATLTIMRQENDQVTAKMNEAEQRITNLNDELKIMTQSIELKMKQVDKLTVELEKANRMVDFNEAGTTDLKIKAVEKTLQSTEQDIRERQQFWVLLQNHFVHLSIKRNAQVNEIQLTRKQLSIIKQKSLRIDSDLEATEIKTSNLLRDIRAMTLKIEQLNAKMYEKRTENESNENQCEMGHADYMHKLKENETRVLEQESEIDEQQTELEQLKDLVLEKHREALSWETKYKLIEETLRWRKDENDMNSEIGTMKFEIHRMQIRHDQLKRAQEKLVQDLDQCVMHRDQIFTTATQKQRINSMPKRQRSKAATPAADQKFIDLRNKLKLIQSEISSFEDRLLVEAQQALDKIRADVEQLRKNIDLSTEEAAKIQDQIEQSVLLKHYNLETIIRKQNRVKAYGRLGTILEDGSPKMPRPESVIDMLAQKQADFNDYLLNTVQLLNTKFPEYKTQLARISQLLRD